jgi:hypothetical protein
MSKGAKPGQNRFAGAQKRLQDYRVKRIKDEVIPKLKSYAGKITFDGITPFSKFCAELYNTELPVNEKQMGYRTFVQSNEYWKQVGPIYYKYWDASGSTEQKKQKLIGKLAVKRADTLQADLERLKQENEALRAALRAHGAKTTSSAQPKLTSANSDENEYMLKFDKTCRALKLVLDATEGTITAQIDEGKITCAFDDLEPAEGLVPRLIAQPYINWLKSKGDPK